jgi:hypothetical protein
MFEAVWRKQVTASHGYLLLPSAQCGSIDGAEGMNTHDVKAHQINERQKPV